MAEFQIYEDQKGEHRYRLQSSNYEKVCQSEGYTTRAHAERGVDDLIENVLEAAGISPEAIEAKKPTVIKYL